MLKVYKYKIKVDNYFELDLPYGAWVLDVDLQKQDIYLWALVNPDAELEKRRFRFAGTGHEIDEEVYQLSHIKTFQIMAGSLVFHIFEIIKEE